MVYRLDLLAKLFRHGRPIGFVFRVNLVSKGWALCVENNHQLISRIIGLQALQHTDHALGCTGIHSFTISQWG